MSCKIHLGSPSPRGARFWLALGMAAIGLSVATGAPAQEAKVEPRAYAGPVNARIRGVSGAGLTPSAFAQWLADNPQAVRPGGDPMIGFSRADIVDDGRVSAPEPSGLIGVLRGTADAGRYRGS